jgi:hypothetical protein
MKALSIRQPWAWLIVRPDLTCPGKRSIADLAGEIKDIENRSWPTKVRGRVLVHAAQGMTQREYDEVSLMLLDDSFKVDTMPTFKALQRGGIIGSVDIVDCVTTSESPWFFGEFGFVLRDAKPLPFVPFKGSLGFFEVPDSILEAAHV